MRLVSEMCWGMISLVERIRRREVLGWMERWLGRSTILCQELRVQIVCEFSVSSSSRRSPSSLLDEAELIRIPRSLLRWILVTPGEDFPENALPIGCESTSSPSSKILFAARGYSEFSVQIGKVSPNLPPPPTSSFIPEPTPPLQAGTHLGSPRHSFATSSLPGREAFFFQNTFEILCTSSTPSTSTPTKWITVSSHMLGDEVRELMRGEKPVEGGRERNGAWLGVGKGILKG